MKYRVYEKEGRWLMESSDNRGKHACATVCDSREAAEQLKRLSETMHGKTIQVCIHGHYIKARVCNVGVLHHDGMLVDTLYFRYNGGVYSWPAAACEEVKA